MRGTKVSTGVLQRPIWHALTTRQSGLAAGTPRAKRFPLDVSPFAATARDDAASLADLALLTVPGEALVFLQEGPIPTPPGFVQEFRGSGVQMTATCVHAPEHTADVLDLGENDAADMLALATLTRPGPFLARTNTLGAFVGIPSRRPRTRPRRPAVRDRRRPHPASRRDTLPARVRHQPHGYRSVLPARFRSLPRGLRRRLPSGVTEVRRARPLISRAIPPTAELHDQVRCVELRDAAQAGPLGAELLDETAKSRPLTRDLHFVNAGSQM
jgi:hypothetical protein